MAGKVTRKKREIQSNFLISREWELLKRHPKYIEDYRSCYRIADPKSRKKAFNKFVRKYHVPPIHPNHTLETIHKTWVEYIEKGGDIPFPLEALYYKGEKNIPIGSHTIEPRFFVRKDPEISLSDLLLNLEAVLDGKGVRGTRKGSNTSPFLEPPIVLSKVIIFNYNSEATKKKIIIAVKDFLRKQGFKDSTRKVVEEVFKRQMAAYDFRRNHPKITYKVQSRKAFSKDFKEAEHQIMGCIKDKEGFLEFPPVTELCEGCSDKGHCSIKTSNKCPIFVPLWDLETKKTRRRPSLTTGHKRDWLENIPKETREDVKEESEIESYYQAEYREKLLYYYDSKQKVNTQNNDRSDESVSPKQRRLKG